MALTRSWRLALVKLHRWIAFSAGILLVLNAFTGLILLAGRPIDEALHPQLFKVQPQAGRASMEPLRQALRAEFPTQSFTIHPGGEAGEAMDVSVRGEGGWEGKLFIDPHTGRELGRRNRFGLNLDGLFELHSSLLWGKTGKAVLGGLALAMLLMLLSGALLWWPARWRNAFTATLKGPRLRVLFDLHRVGGAALGLWVLVCVASGGLLAYRPAVQWINQAAGAQPQEAPKLAPAQGGEPVPTASLDDLLGTARAAVPNSSVGSVGLPAGAKQPVRIRLRQADDPHPVGLTSVWLDPRSGAMLRLDPWRTLAPGERSLAWIYPLHSGQLAGAVGTLIAAIGGLALLGFGVSGTWLWWLRRPKPARRTDNSVASLQARADS